MADANNTLRLQIVTQLDNAGIKYTKEQIDQLELGLRRAGKSGSEAGQEFGKLEKALGKLPGPIGNISNAIGGYAGKLGLILGAFQTGFSLGEKLRETTVKIWLFVHDCGYSFAA